MFKPLNHASTLRGRVTWRSVGSLPGFLAPLRWPSHTAPGICCSRPFRSTRLRAGWLRRKSQPLPLPEVRLTAHLPLFLGLTCLIGQVSHVGGVQVPGSVVVLQGCVEVFLLVGIIAQLLFFQCLEEV